MDICFELNRERDVATIRVNAHHPLKRVWKTLPIPWVLQFDPQGELVALEVPRKTLAQWGVHLPVNEGR